MDQQHKQEYHHQPVLVAEAIEWLAPSLGTGGLLVDCTVGGGGHALAFLEAFSEMQLLGVDRDPAALKAAETRLAAFGSRVRLIKGNFSTLAGVLHELDQKPASAVFYDLGVSSPQLDRPERGFQFRSGAPLDMRMDPESPQKAADIVNNYSERALVDVIGRYGEERFAARVARAIVDRRRRRPFTDAGDLADVIKHAIPAATRRTGPHPARRSFQALRIEVNDELNSLEQSLTAAVECVRPGGRVAAISYHSLEDRIVKGAFRRLSEGCICPRDLPVCRCERQAELRVLTKKPIRPGPEEVSGNPRSDSARLRVAEKIRLQPPENS